MEYFYENFFVIRKSIQYYTLSFSIVTCNVREERIKEKTYISSSLVNRSSSLSNVQPAKSTNSFSFRLK